MPGLVPAREQKLSGGIALDETVFGAVFIQPGKQLLVHVLIDQALVLPVHDVHREAQLVLAAARIHDDLLGLLREFLIPRVHIVDVPGQLAGLGVEHLGLIGIGPVRRGDIDRVPRRFRRVDHGVEVGNIVRVEHHILGPVDHAAGRLKRGGQQELRIIVDHTVLALCDVDIRPAVVNLFGLLRFVGSRRDIRIRRDDRPVDSAEDHVRLCFQPRHDDRRERQAQDAHAQQPRNPVLHRFARLLPFSVMPCIVQPKAFRFKKIP